MKRFEEDTHTSPELAPSKDLSVDVRQQIDLGIALEADELGLGTVQADGGHVLYEKTERGWQATFHEA